MKNERTAQNKMRPLPPRVAETAEEAKKAEKGRHFGDEAGRTGEIAATLATEAAVPAKLPQPSKI